MLYLENSRLNPLDYEAKEKEVFGTAKMVYPLSILPQERMGVNSRKFGRRLKRGAKKVSRGVRRGIGYPKRAFRRRSLREELIQAIIEAVDLSKVQKAFKAKKLISSGRAARTAGLWKSSNRAANAAPVLRSWASK